MFNKFIRAFIPLMTAAGIASADENNADRDIADFIPAFSQSCLEEFSKVAVDDAHASIGWNSFKTYQDITITTLTQNQDEALRKKSEIILVSEEDNLTEFKTTYGLGYMDMPSMKGTVRAVYDFKNQAEPVVTNLASQNRVVVAMQAEAREQIEFLEQAIETCGLQEFIPQRDL